MNPNQIVEYLSSFDIDIYLDSDSKLKAKHPKGVLTSELASLIKDNKIELIEYLSNLGSSAACNTNTITAQPRDNKLMQLSFSQQRLWVIDQLQGGTPEYNMPTAYEVTGKLDLSLVTDIFTQIIERHEVLRTVFQEVHGEAMQQVRSMSEVNFAINVKDLSHLTREIQSHEVAAYVENDTLKPFDLSQDLMLRVSYICTGSHTGVLVFNMHHIASDGWSMEVLSREFFELYEAFSDGKQSPLPKLEIQYADYAHWQRENLSGEALDKQLDYWANQLDEISPLHSLPLSYARPEVKEHVGAIVYGTLSSEISSKLQVLAERFQLTPFMLMHGALSLLLSRHSNSSDIVIGTPIANRLQEELAPLIGFFVNTLVLRTNTEHATLSDYFAHVRQVHLGAQSNQDVPFEQLVERLKVSRSTAHTPLFQIVLTTNTDYGLDRDSDAVKLSEITLAPYKSDMIQAKFDLHVSMHIGDEGIEVSWKYDVSLFDEANIQRLNEHFCRLLTALSDVYQSDIQPNKLPILSQEEELFLLTESEYVTTSQPTQQCIHELFEQQAYENPDSVALVFEGAQLTYQALNERANQLAHYLIETQGVKPDTLVGLYVERSLETVIGILGILKAGGAYVPLDPSYPQERLAYMISDAELKTIVSHASAGQVLAEYSGHVIDLEDVTIYQNYSKQNLDKCALGLTRSHLAYVIYTSGSTGRPKGVLQTHQNVLRLFSVTQDDFGFNGNDCWCLFHSISFDFSVWELWGSLAFGGKLIILSRHSVKDFDLIVDSFNQHGLTVLNQTPSAFKALVEYLSESKLTLPSLEKVIFGGEALLSHHVQQWFNEESFYTQATLINMYGITETTVHVTYRKVEDISSGQIHIGKPLADQSIIIFDQNMNLTPKGVVGEAYVGGNGLARGYLNRAELSAERFIDNPFYDEHKPSSSKRLYRTGDLMRCLPDGNLEYIGRADHQVKIRGYRIELGEVETQLAQQLNIDSALVLAKELAGSQQLVGYVRPSIKVEEGAHSTFISELKASLSSQLPEHMVPSILLVVSDWPLTPNGKVDRKALPQPESYALQREYVAPVTRTEKILAEIWSELLDIKSDTLSVTANFFELGGHSLLIMKLIGLASSNDLHIQAQDVFTAPNLKALASLNDAYFAQRDAVSFEVPENLIPEHCEHITPDMLPLVNLTEAEIYHIAKQVPKGMANIEDIYPLGPLQAGILYTHLISEAHDPYVTPLLFKIKNQAALDDFINGMRFLIQRHDVLRTMVLHDGLSKPVQVVCKEASVPVKWLDIPEGVDVETVMLEKSRPEQQWLDLSQAPLFQLQIARKNEQESYLLLQMHHMITDHVSLDIVQRELNAFNTGMADKLAPVQPYRNFIAYTANQFETKQAEAHFKSILGDVESSTAPFDLTDIRSNGADMEELIELVPHDIAQQVRTLAKQLKLSPASLFHAAYSLVLAACSNKQDVVFGSVMSGRLQGLAGTESMLGVFINTLPVRAQLNSKSVLDFVSDIQSYLQALLPFEQTPLAVAQSCSGVPDNSPLFSAMLNFRHSGSVESSDVQDIEQEQSIELISSQERTNYPFNLSVDDLGEDFALDFQVDPSIDVNRVMGYMQKALAELTAHLSTSPQTCITTLNVIPSDEFDYLTNTLNDTAMAYPLDKCVHELFEQQVAERPDAIALEYAGEQLTYRELNTRANQLAHYLISQGVQVEQSVGICLPRSIDMVVSVLGILKAGATYIPLDPEYPSARLSHIFEDTNLRHLITHSTLVTSLAVDGVTLYESDKLIDVLTGNPATNIARRAAHNEASLAYMIFTSGSTGKPKGVMITHQALVNHVVGMADRLPGVFSWPNKLLAVTTIAFDIAGLELFGPLAYGGQVVLTPSDETKDPRKLSALLTSKEITCMQATPATWQMLVNDDWSGKPDLVALTGGEALPINLAQSLLPRIYQLWNCYGPTEATIWSLVNQVDRQQAEFGRIKLGGSLGNYSHFVLNELGQLQPLGCVGELHIGGISLARGYLNRAELTAQRFIDNPYFDPSNPMSSKKLYKTGDLVRYLADGNLAFLGRIDDQVKIRGFRIELGEIEALLCEQEQVESAQVVAKEVGGRQQLVGYVKPMDVSAIANDETFIHSLFAILQDVLPSYMVPSNLINIAKWPVTPNGKIDKKALPSPNGVELQGEYVAPETDTESMLVSIWADVLGIEAEMISTSANYYSLGGNSITSVQMVLAAAKKGLKLNVGDFMKYQTISDLAVVASKNSEPAEASIVKEAPLSERSLVVCSADAHLTSLKRHDKCWYSIIKFDETTTETHIRHKVKQLLKSDKALTVSIESENSVSSQNLNNLLLSKRYLPVNRDLMKRVLHEITYTEQACTFQEHLTDMAASLMEQVAQEHGPLIRFTWTSDEIGHFYLVVVAHKLLLNESEWELLIDDFGQEVINLKLSHEEDAASSALYT
ncbi:non-ribosomal peptide synthetase [Pseudoalteromonas luteoviolacea]|uniref:Carrier domain-containing protein n=1 Tax=Pseudoalteromonas luteoviolacea S4054 TaxID=1129367 RepID=A0A0F6A8R2_9GAMM|nr:non-ribosomal peptide synthetase [Pseudoalteromonas luteoviolacea]AOT10868.1 hypothetical protein S4054249_23775 [Pseudoalteromonas luteoviolacea]AOT15970.1 hypothetical protein S40542_24735 [Pseudoalteromonas luteoviolacea]AOT20689.1 hypothetical protein S4054_23695 [Pseudoalteromonas luteoviolacea]KKE81789.1 hypothetical protein N479_02175 [Pseudoalteromonas luteoviolacea S4054]KZN66253.1 hypothetical protein N481_24905 [Pseudoalteromonas luteoviolacea S4047-1]